MKIIGITGGIGSGKSTAAQMFSEMYQLPIIDADVLSKEASERPEVVEKIKKTFGTSCIDETNGIDRAKLAEIVFCNTGYLKKLNAIIHPIVMEEFKKQCFDMQKSGKEYIIFDCPLLIEEQLQDLVDLTVLIYANKETRIERIMQRSGLSYKETINRIEAQMDLDEKIAFSNIVIYNNGTIDELKTALKYLYKEVIS